MALTLVPFNSATTDRRTAGLLNGLTLEEPRIKMAGEHKSMPPAPTLEREKVAASPAPSSPMTVDAARAMLARVDAAEANGVEMNDENMRALGFVETEGGTIELPIPVEILRQL